MKKKDFLNQALLILIVLGLIWGSGYSIARYVMTHGVHPIGYSFWQCLGPAIILGMLSFKKLKWDSQHIKFYFICGLVGIAIPNTNMYFVSSHLPAGLLAVVVNTVPVMIYPMALLVRQEKFEPLRLLGVLSAIIGILCLVIPKTTIPHVHEIGYILMGLITPFCFAFFTLFINPHRPSDSDPLSLAAGMLVTSTLLLTPLVMTTQGFYNFSGSHLNNGLIILEIILSSVGYVLFFKLLKIAGPVYYSLVDGVVALTGLFWGRILFKEHFELLNLLALFLIIIGIMLVNLRVRLTKS
jgi:drug/metabolite transporter (DMT)-like permease